MDSKNVLRPPSTPQVHLYARMKDVAGGQDADTGLHHHVHMLLILLPCNMAYYNITKFYAIVITGILFLPKLHNCLSLFLADVPELCCVVWTFANTYSWLPLELERVCI